MNFVYFAFYILASQLVTCEKAELPFQYISLQDYQTSFSMQQNEYNQKLVKIPLESQKNLILVDKDNSDFSEFKSDGVSQKSETSDAATVYHDLANELLPISELKERKVSYCPIEQIKYLDNRENREMFQNFHTRIDKREKSKGYVFSYPSPEKYCFLFKKQETFAKSDLIDEDPKIQVHSNKHTTKLEKLDFQQITPRDDGIGEMSKSDQKYGDIGAISLPRLIEQDVWQKAAYSDKSVNQDRKTACTSINKKNPYLEKLTLEVTAKHKINDSAPTDVANINWAMMVPVTEYIQCQQNISGSFKNKANLVLNYFKNTLEVVHEMFTFGSFSNEIIDNPKIAPNKLMKKAAKFFSNDLENDSEMYEPTTAQLFSQHDLLYTVNVKLGNDDEPYKLLIDTGSFHTWVYSSSCSSKECNGLKKYNGTGNNELMAVGKLNSSYANNAFSVQYNTGQVNGTLVRDRMKLAGFDSPQYFGIAQWVGPEFEYFKLDGILGLPSFDKAPVPLNKLQSKERSGSNHEFPGFMNTLYTQNLINKRVFGVSLGRTRGLNASQQEIGSITFGGIDESKFEGNITYAPLVKNRGYWEVDLEKVDINGVQVISKTNLGNVQTLRTAILDTGTSQMVLNIQDALGIYSLVPDALTDGKNFAIPCNTTLNLGITLGGKRWRVPVSDFLGSPFNFEMTDNSNKAVSLSPDIKYCKSHIVGTTDSSSKFWILGQVFLKNLYSVYDMDNQRVGLAPKKSNLTLDEIGITYDSMFVYKEEAGKGFAMKRKRTKKSNSVKLNTENQHDISNWSLVNLIKSGEKSDISRVDNQDSVSSGAKNLVKIAIKIWVLMAAVYLVF